ncbi:hypothetical protein [Alicyclobacillus fodiniaquatilis]|uniref:Uncharacterized protein n=1 Tax=Alicyclobacillus fodiniaquatilis TaxID=1661150 RepID=A0ABW4JGX8_9BACL
MATLSWDGDPDTWGLQTLVAFGRRETVGVSTEFLLATGVGLISSRPLDGNPLRFEGFEDSILYPIEYIKHFEIPTTPYTAFCKRTKAMLQKTHLFRNFIFKFLIKQLSVYT